MTELLLVMMKKEHIFSHLRFESVMLKWKNKVSLYVVTVLLRYLIRYSANDYITLCFRMITFCGRHYLLSLERRLFVCTVMLCCEVSEVNFSFVMFHCCNGILSMTSGKTASLWTYSTHFLVLLEFNFFIHHQCDINFAHLPFSFSLFFLFTTNIPLPGLLSLYFKFCMVFLLSWGI